MPTPLILDTDIGTDIDDAYALVLAASSPALDLRAVTTVNGDTELRAAIARRLLLQMGRAELPVGAGLRSSLSPGEPIGWAGFEGQGIDLDGLGPEGLAPGGALGLLSELVVRAWREAAPLTIVTIGAMTNLAALLDELPRAALAGIAGVVSMASNYGGKGEEAALPEHNVACDPVAFERVLRSGLPLRLVGLNVTKRVPMDRARMERLTRGGPLGASLRGMHEVWFQAIHAEASPMHDGLAVASLIDPGVLRFERVSARPSGTGRPRGSVTFLEEGDLRGAACEVATDVDVARFDALLDAAVTAKA